MTNKKFINKLKNYAEISWATYFSLEYVGKRNIYLLDKDSKKIPNNNFPRNFEETNVTLKHSIFIEFNHFEVLINLKENNSYRNIMLNDINERFNKDKLNGVFGNLQSQNFVSRCKLLFHQPNTTSGFSATLFYDTFDDEYIVGFRGTEIDSISDVVADINIAIGNGRWQLGSLIEFLTKISETLNNIPSDKIVFVGHSLGGYLATIATQICDTADIDSLVKINFTPSKTFTFNSPQIGGISNMLKNVIYENFFDNFITQDLLHPEKIYNVYDSSGVEIIASAKYANINNIPINTIKNSHSIISLTQTLYLYSYILEYHKNEDMIKGKELEDAIKELNSFSDKIYITTSPFEELMIKREIRSKEYMFRDDKKTISSTFIKPFNYTTNNTKLSTLINQIAYESKNFLDDERLKDIYIIENIIELMQKDAYIQILDFNSLKDSDLDRVLVKRAVHKNQPFIIIHKDDSSYLDKDSYTKTYKHNSDSTKTLIYSNGATKEYLKAKKEQSINLFSNDEALKTIYLRDSFNSLNHNFLNLNSTIFTHNNTISIFSIDKDIIDVNKIYDTISSRLEIPIDKLKSYKVDLYLYGKLLKGGYEFSDNRHVFGNVKDDKKEHDKIKESNPTKDITKTLYKTSKEKIVYKDKDPKKPLYYFQEAKDDNIGSLTITDNNQSITIKNYSLDLNSLDITLYTQDKKEKNYKDISAQSLTTNLLKSISSKDSIAVDYAVIESDTIVCPHGGKVILKSQRGKNIKSNSTPIILASDYINSKIVGCGAKNRCFLVSSIPNSTLSKKTINGDKAPLQSLIKNSKTNSGASLTCIPKPNKFKFTHSLVTKESSFKKDSNYSKDNLNSYLRFHFKTSAFQKDNLPVSIYSLNSKEYKSRDNFSSITLNLDEARSVSDDSLKHKLESSYRSDRLIRYEFKEFELKFHSNIYTLIFIVPSLKDSFQSYYKRVYEFEDRLKDKKESNKDSIKNTLIFLTPNNTEEVEILLAKGLDRNIQSSINILDIDLLVGDSYITEESKDNTSWYESVIDKNKIIIQALDGSGSIEIEPSYKIDDPPIEPTVSPLSAGLLIKRVFKNRLKDSVKSGSLTREEVIEIVERLSAGKAKDRTRRTVKNKKELDEIWNKISKDSKQVKIVEESIKNKKTGVANREKIIIRELDDKSVIKYRTGSRSGGETVDLDKIKSKNIKPNKKIEYYDKDWRIHIE